MVGSLESFSTIHKRAHVKSAFNVIYKLSDFTGFLKELLVIFFKNFSIYWSKYGRPLSSVSTFFEWISSFFLFTIKFHISTFPNFTNPHVLLQVVFPVKFLAASSPLALVHRIHINVRKKSSELVNMPTSIIILMPFDVISGEVGWENVHSGAKWGVSRQWIFWDFRFFLKKTEQTL